jgi:putative DNA primase/helicase
MIQNFITSFREAIQLAGIRPPEIIHDDGQLHRFGTSEKPGDKAGWYILYGDGIPAGSFGDWRTGANHSWHADVGRTFTEAEKLAHQKKLNTMRQAREAAEEKRQDNALSQALSIWNNAIEAPLHHPYLVQKGVEAYGLRAYKGALIVPVRIHERVQSLQFIESIGNKRFLSGGKIKGGYFSIGTPKDIICICEGYATGASIFKATGYAIAVAFSAGNLLAVAQFLRQKFPKIQLILCADDDYATPENPGFNKAREAASLVGGKLAVPHFGENRVKGMTDFNDLYQKCGIEAVKEIIAAAKLIKNERLPTDNNVMCNQSGVKLVCAADLKPEPIAWIWKDWLAAGKFHLLAGTPGTGKTTLGLNLAAIITRGDEWPDGTQSEPGNVLIWSGEDSLHDTLLPRLLAHRADLQRVYFINHVIENNTARAFEPSQDIPKLYNKARQIGDVRLIMIDPVVSVVAGDSHKNTEVRRALQPLVELSEQLKAAVLGISHFSKSSMGRDPLERITGSIAFGALARIVLATVKTRDSKRLLVRTKSNLGPDGGGYYYQIKQIALSNHPEISASQMEWGDLVEGSAEELLIDSSSQSMPDKRSAFTEAVDFLKVLLAEGPVLKQIVATKAKEAGFTEMTLRRAKTFLNIKSVHDGYGTGSVWKWCLPSTMMQSVDTHTMSSFEIDEPL